MIRMTETQSLRGFARLVLEMRTAQNRHARTREEDDWRAAKGLEVKVDRAASEVLARPMLFDPEGP
jgi:hypothetical protein